MNSLRKIFIAAMTVIAVPLTISAPAAAQSPSPSPAGATVTIINLKDGDTVTSPFKVQFGPHRHGEMTRDRGPF
jgi:Spy/CpxP family protein refolding chaperone